MWQKYRHHAIARRLLLHTQNLRPLCIVGADVLFSQVLACLRVSKFLSLSVCVRGWACTVVRGNV